MVTAERPRISTLRTAVSSRTETLENPAHPTVISLRNLNVFYGLVSRGDGR